jgi:hypothetical protein
MSFETVVGLLITGLPLEAFLLAWLWKVLSRHIPENRLKLLKEFITDAVQMVEQQYSGKLTSDQKKQRAGDAVVNLLHEAHHKAPSDSVIGDLIDSAVYALNQQKITLPSSNATQPLVEPSPLRERSTKPPGQQ